VPDKQSMWMTTQMKRLDGNEGGVFVGAEGGRKKKMKTKWVQGKFTKELGKGGRDRACEKGEAAQLPKDRRPQNGW